MSVKHLFQLFQMERILEGGREVELSCDSYQMNENPVNFLDLV